ncbi:hypothetical protein [Kingella potus]|uniref:hypothetical protein n=1 Tax=Kingella potus TaxID=265175 RepID=UPI001FD21E18|nr:hypothetical protein [Kingella potus]UOP01959.1 hypothetical protein LVJ84_08860 [Kingella potus]
MGTFVVGAVKKRADYRIRGGRLKTGGAFFRRPVRGLFFQSVVERFFNQIRVKRFGNQLEAAVAPP